MWLCNHLAHISGDTVPLMWRIISYGGEREYELITEAHAQLSVIWNCSRFFLPVSSGGGEQLAGGGWSAVAGEGGGGQTLQRWNSPSMTGVALSGSCSSPIQGEKRDLSCVFHPESLFSIILTRVKIIVVFFTIAGQKIIKSLSLNVQQIAGLCKSLTLNTVNF